MNKDDQIQKQIEEGNIPEGIDGEAYRLVFKAIRREPEFKLSADFATKVASRAQTPSKAFDWDKFFLFTGIGAFASVFLYATVVTGFTPSFGVFQFLKGHPLFIVLAVLFIMAGQWLDKKLLKNIQP